MITIKPTIRYWLMTNALPLLVVFVSILIINIIRIHPYAKITLGVIVCVCLCMSAWNYIVLQHITYIIEQEQIIVKRGVFFRTTNFVEMYRIYDYEKKQNLVELWLHIMNIVLLSRDLSNNRTVFVGIQNSDDIIPIIRDRVEREKQRKGIVELNNTGMFA